MGSKKEVSDLDYAFKKAQLDLMLIEIEERRFRLDQEKKKAVDKDLEDFFKKLPKTNPTVTDRTWPTEAPFWKQPHIIPTPFTSEQKFTLGTTANGAVVNCGVKKMKYTLTTSLNKKITLSASTFVFDSGFIIFKDNNDASVAAYQSSHIMAVDSENLISKTV